MFLLSPVRLTLFLLVFLCVPHPSLQGRSKGRWNKGGKFRTDPFTSGGQRLLYSKVFTLCPAGWGCDQEVIGLKKSCRCRPLWRSVNNSKQTPILWENCSPPSQAASNPLCGIKERAVILAAAPGEDSLMLIRSPWVSQALQNLAFKESPVLRVSHITALQWLFLISPVESACSTPVCIPTHACLAFFFVVVSQIVSHRDGAGGCILLALLI
ncbi:hypothetical protein QQF64_008950 [Cirrhinus molitorella]|uniref:Uncharacterized protein n=1 Tax=Cirrhinus molitorella TaxID=172907 RepID=A0ABR3MBR0_9TELE